MKRVGQILRDKLKESIKESIGQNRGTFLLSYSAISSSQMNDLRKDLRKVGAHISASKNRIAKIALKELKQDQFAKHIEGQTAFVWSNNDAAVVSKVLMKFSEDKKGIVIRGGLLEGTILNKEDIKRLSDLPSREVLLTQLVRTMISPVSRLLGAMNGKTRDLLSILKQLSEKKGG